MILPTAMVLAAGLGSRMRPLTDDRPKALVEVGGRALIDHALDRLQAAGVTRAVVNVHAFADRLEAHLRGRAAPAIVISDERGELLETGGGVEKARPLLGDAPIWVANINSVLLDGAAAPLPAMLQAWDPARMDALLLLAPLEQTLGFDGPGDFFMDADGALAPRGSAERAPYAYIGFHILKPGLVDDGPDGPFSLNRVWRDLATRGRLHGVVFDGFWMHVGDPRAREAAQAKLQGAGR